MSELSVDEVQGLVREVALATIGRGKFIDVRSAETTDLDGDRALDITVVLATEDVANTMPVMETLVGVRKELQRKGDERFPFIRYVTPEDETASDEDEA